eukprot:1661290-Rhodomonas_salina.1
MGGEGDKEADARGYDRIGSRKSLVRDNSGMKMEQRDERRKAAAEEVRCAGRVLAMMMRMML